MHLSTYVGLLDEGEQTLAQLAERFDVHPVRSRSGRTMKEDAVMGGLLARRALSRLAAR